MMVGRGTGMSNILDRWNMFALLHNDSIASGIGESPSGKAAAFEAAIRRFESFLPSHVPVALRAPVHGRPLCLKNNLRKRLGAWPAKGAK